MRAVILPADTSACGLYRLKWPSEAVKEARPDWTIEAYLPGALQLATDDRGILRAVKGLPDLDTVDLVVMQRVHSQSSVAFIKYMQNQGTAVVVDSDDAMWCIDPRNPAFKSWAQPGSHWRWMDRAAEIADVVTVTTPYLASRYGRHGRVEVLPNAVPEEVLALDAPQDREGLPRLGWAGFTATHPDDLTVVGNSVSQAVRSGKYVATVLGDSEGAARDWGLDPGEVSGIPPQALGEPFYTALGEIDVALVPLKDSPFNRGKSYLKALEFSARGVPVIVSDTPAHRELAKTVPIRIAKTQAQWTRHLNALQDVQTRREAGREAQAAVLASHTIEGRVGAWIAAWERALVRRERLSR